MKKTVKSRAVAKVDAKRRVAFAGMFCLMICVFFLSACGGRSAAPSRPEVRPRPPAEKKLANLGFTIQAGAFSRVENAARLTDALRLQGLDAYYFVSSSGLFKVRFGNFSTKTAARQRAEALRMAGVIVEFYIVSPEEYASARRTTLGDDYLRDQLIKTAKEFIGVPYLWGGTTPENGFDCSGLVMAVYQLNGLALPRTSRDQFEAGMPVDRDRMQKGDLVFFANGKNDPISHVGIYIGNSRFIHAPGRGKTIRIDLLSSRFYTNRYMGSRTYL
ncbi:MAG: Murein DD-endopeptidase MepH precursor [Syntrophus sp. PtaU1.Bin208]|nr:MAG: Murein DD-endopeptidase MepH precursor [Syntrophus sp. PtaU1.Bin208]